MTRSLCALALCALFSSPIHAGSVEFAQWVPWKFVEEELRKTDFSFQETEPELRLSLGELKPVLKNVNFRIKGHLQEIEFSQGTLSLQADAALELRLGEISIDQLITREFGGNVFQVHIKATCASASLSVPAMAINPLFALNEGNQFFPKLDDLHYSMKDWKISPVHCEGISGVGAEIVASLEESLNRPAIFSPFIESWISPFLNDWLRSRWLLIRSSEGQWDDLIVSSADETGFLLKGSLPLKIADDISLSEVPAKYRAAAPQFILSQEGFHAIIRDRLTATLPLNYDLRENAGFRKLMASRLLQFFVWPDLLRYSAGTPFVLRNVPSSLMLKLSSTTSTLSSQGRFVTLIGGAPIDYLHYKLNLSIPLKIELRNGIFTFNTGNVTSQVTWEFSPLYKLLYRPDTKIPVNVITSAINTLASNKKKSVELPRFHFGEREFRLGNFHQEDQLITMDWL